MGMPTNLFAAAFREQRLGLMFSLIMVILVFLGSLAIAAQATLARTSVAWGYQLRNRLTVEVPSIPDEVAAIRRERVEKVKALLEQKPGVAQVTLVREEETTGLLRPWIADPALLASLPLPSLLDVDIKVGDSLDPVELERSLSGENADIQVHSHADWMGNLQGFLMGLGVLAAIMLILTGLALVASIFVVCRAAMAVQHDTIELLHFLGATDNAIARQFQGHVMRLAVPASLVGFALAFMTVGALIAVLKSLGGISLIASASWVTLGTAMGVIPVGAILLAILTARLSVLKFLRMLR